MQWGGGGGQAAGTFFATEGKRFQDLNDCSV